MKWFSAVIVSHTVIDVEDYEPLFDRTVILIHAKNEEHAQQRANEIGLEKQVDYLNEFGETVRWVFVESSEVQEVEGFFDGAEVFSRLSWS